MNNSIKVNAPSSDPVLPQAIGVGKYPFGIAISPDGAYSFVGNLGGNTVSVIDLQSGPPFYIRELVNGVGGTPTGIAVSANGDYVFVEAISKMLTGHKKRLSSEFFVNFCSP